MVRDDDERLARLAHLRVPLGRLDHALIVRADDLDRLCAQAVLTLRERATGRAWRCSARCTPTAS